VVLLKDGARIVTAIALRMIHASRVRIIQVCVHNILLMIFKQAVQASGALSERWIQTVAVKLLLGVLLLLRGIVAAEVGERWLLNRIVVIAGTEPVNLTWWASSLKIPLIGGKIRTLLLDVGVDLIWLVVSRASTWS
jgi:hypothetical protein